MISRFVAVVVFSLVASLEVGCQSVNAHQLVDSVPSSNTFDDRGEYLIGKGDVLGISVHGDDSLSGSYTVDDNGETSIPLVGFLAAEGLTIRQFQKRVETSFAPYVQTPKVSAWVAERRSFHAYFCGEVAKVGLVTFTEPVSLLQGLTMAGGLTPYASNKILILRKTQGHTERYAVTYKSLISGGKPFDTFHIDRGDTIIVE